MALIESVYHYVMEHEESEEFYKHLLGLMNQFCQAIRRKENLLLTIAIGCTGGQRRSVAFAKRLADDLEKN